jgi:hypothetical protein
MLKHQVALRLPQQVQALAQHGQKLFLAGQIDEADPTLRLAIDLVPFDPRLHVLLGQLRYEQGRPHEALKSFDKALSLKPGWPEAEYQRAKALLVLGRYEDGWAAHETRFARPEFLEAMGWRSRSPRWAGEPLTGRLLIYNDFPGFGDAFQFVRYVPLLGRCTELVVAVQAPLVELLRHSPALRTVPVVPFGSEVDHGAHVALMSLPHLLNRPQPYCPAQPYLAAEPARVAAWQQRLGRHGVRVGVNWASTPRHHYAVQRSFPLAALAPLAAVSGVRLVSLQKCNGLDQLAELPRDMTVETLEGLDAGPDGFVDTAAVMMSLDLVISSDTAVAHLAGALGRPVWVALPSAPDWRWGLEHQETPWYPTMRLFRQSQAGGWANLVQHVQETLSSRTYF